MDYLVRRLSLSNVYQQPETQDFEFNPKKTPTKSNQVEYLSSSKFGSSGLRVETGSPSSSSSDPFSKSPISAGDPSAQSPSASASPSPSPTLRTLSKRTRSHSECLFLAKNHVKDELPGPCQEYIENVQQMMAKSRDSYMLHSGKQQFMASKLNQRRGSASVPSSNRL